MKSTKRIYTVHCKQPLTDEQILHLKSFLGIDEIQYAKSRLTIKYDLQFIDRKSIMKHLKQLHITFRYFIVHRMANAVEIFSEKNVIKNHRLMTYNNY